MMDEGFPNFDIGDVESLFASSGHFSLDSPPMLSDDPVSSSVHPNSSLLGDGNGADAALLGPSDSHSNVSSTTTDHQASASQFLGHLDGVPGSQSSTSHDDIFFTGNTSRSINPGTNSLQGQNNSSSSVGINNLFSNNNGASSKGGPPSQQSFGPASVSASSISNPSPQQPHTPHTPQPHTPQPHTPHTPRSHPIPSPSPVGAMPMASPANSVPMASPVASLPPPSPAQNQIFSKPLKSPASVPGMASSIKSPMNIAPPSPSPNSSLSSQSQTNQILHSSNAAKPASGALSSISSSAPIMRGVASVAQNQQIQSAQGQVLLSAQPTMIQGGSTMLTGTPVVQQGVPTLIQTATGGLMQINLQPQLGAIGSVASQVNVPTSARLPLALSSVAVTAPATSLVSSIAQNANPYTKATSATRQQQQILPKYSTSTGGKPSSAASLQYTISATQNTPVAQTQTLTTGASPLLLSTGGAVLQTLQGVATASPQPTNQIVLGQNLVVGNAAQPVQNSPFLIQQPNGNPPVIMVRSNPPSIQQSTPTILPIVSQAAGAPAGTLLLQQPQPGTANGATAAGMITAQPQVKIITPQGRMQVQQIQTPSGPKLITVPVGQSLAGQTTTIVPQTIQTGTPTGTGGANTLGQMQQIAGSTAFATIGTPTIVSNLPRTLAAPSSSGLSTSLIQSVPTMGGMGLPIATPVSSSSTSLVGGNNSTNQQPNASTEASNSQLNATPKSSGTKKKSKRKGKKPDPMAAATTAVVNSALEAVGQKPPTRSGGLDLGELMKDVGLDLEGFGVDEASAQAALSAAGNATMPTLQPSLPIVPQQVFNSSQGGTGASNMGNLTLQPGQAATPIQGSLSINAASATTMSVSGTTSVPLLNNTQTMAAAASLTTGQGSITSPGNQLVAQIQQPLPLQPTSSNQLQLVQGPDGQFILQSAPAPAPATPTILSQTSVAPSSLSQTVGFSNASFLTSIPNAGVQQPSSLTVAGVSTTNTTYTLQPSISQPNLSALPTPTLTSVIDGQQLLPQTGQHQQLFADLSLASSNIQQLPTSQVGLTSYIGGSVGSNIGTSTAVTTIFNSTTTSATASTASVTSAPATTATTNTGGSPTKSKRSNVDPNRLPLYLDTRLPPGWHRKVSQRKSGASAGRYEVFIIGPTGKRFRSRNEMRAFFDKTSNDSNIDPDDFDFSIFGSNNITSGRAPPKTQPGTLPPAPAIPSVSAARHKSSNQTKKVQSATVAPIDSPDKVHLPDVIPTSSTGANMVNTTNLGHSNIVGFSNIDPSSTQTQNSLGASLVSNDGTTLPSALSSAVTSVQKQNSNAKGTLVSDIMKNLEKIGMASVDAAKAARAAADQVREGMDSPSGSATSTEILNRLTDPLPQKPLTLPSEPTLEGLINQQRPNTSQLDDSHTNLQPNLQSQLSMETADADAQISQLLETLQKDPNQLVVEGEKIAEFINSLTSGDDLDSSSPIPTTPTDSSSSYSIVQPKPTPASTQQPMQNIKAQPTHHPSISSTQQPNEKSGSLETPSNSSTVISKTPELTSGTTGFQASFLNSLASSNNPPDTLKRGASQELDCSNIISSITSPVPPQTPNVLSSGFGASQQLAKTDVMSPTIAGSVPPHIACSSPVPLGGTPSLGGAPSQMRAMQNLPNNTRLVRGPNGQYSLQKVHTIELSQEMQASLRIVQSKIQEIEQKSTKNPRDEAELAQLQTKQQQILSTGKPIEGPSSQSFSSQQNATQSSQQVQSTQPSLPPAGPPMVATKSAPPARYPHNSGNQASGLPPSGGLSLNGLSSSMSSIASAASANTPNVPNIIPSKADPTSSSTANSILSSLNGQSQTTSSSTASSGTIPPLTEQQKKIVHEFKQKMASLPPDQQATFIAEHKANLIKQLDFQPTQLQLLRSNHAASQQQQQQLKAPQSIQGLGTPKLPTQPLNPSMINISGNKQKSLPLGAGTISGAVGIKIPTMGGQGLEHQQPSMATGISKQLLTLQPQLNIVTPNQPSTLQNQPSIPGVVLGSLKRPSSTSISDLLPSGQPINKQKKVAWVESQIKKDQNEAVNPKYKTPFSSKEDACKRLLRYHVFDELDESPEEMFDAEEKFEAKAVTHIRKYRSMLDKYHFLLTQESMRQVSSSEEVMLARLWDSDERQLLNTEKEEVKRGEIIELPELPSSWAQRYIELYGHNPPDGVKKYHEHPATIDKSNGQLVPVIKKLPDMQEQIVPNLSKPKIQHDVIDLLDDDEEEEHNVLENQQDNRYDTMDEAMKNQSSLSMSDISATKQPPSNFLGLKFSRNVSGTWNMKTPSSSTEGNRPSVEEITGDDYDEFESIKNELSTFDQATSSSSSMAPMTSNSKRIDINDTVVSGATFKPVEDSDDDDEFSLRDVDTARAVGSILDDDMDDNSNENDSHHRNDIHHPVDTDELSQHVMSVSSHDHHDDHQDIFYDDGQQLVGAGFDDTGDNNSVQNAINSILDTLPQGERMETPDLNNITGFLDSIDDVTDGVQDQERDPVTEAAVNSIL